MGLILSSLDNDEPIGQPASRDKFPTSIFLFFETFSRSFYLVFLKKWLREHRTNPYPSPEEKLDLAKQSSITSDQVNTWFTHARAILQRRHATLRYSTDGIHYRSIGVQCNPPAADQGTMTSMITDEEIIADRTVRVLVPSVKVPPAPTKHEDLAVDEKERPLIVTSTCLDDEQMVKKKKRGKQVFDFLFLVSSEGILLEISNRIFDYGR